LSQFSDEWAALGMKCGETRYLAVWRRAGGNSIQELPAQDLRGEERKGRPSGSIRCRVLTGMNGMECSEGKPVCGISTRKYGGLVSAVVYSACV